MSQFFPALHANAVIDRKVFGVPFHNSTPLLYYNADHFKEAGLDPDKPPRTWDELIGRGEEARPNARATGSPAGASMIPSNYDYGGWMLSALTMSERRPLLSTRTSAARSITTRRRCWAPSQRSNQNSIHFLISTMMEERSTKLGFKPPSPIGTTHPRDPAMIISSSLLWISEEPA